MPSALFVGESSSLSFLLWKLQSAGWKIALVSLENRSYRKHKMYMHYEDNIDCFQIKVQANSMMDLIDKIHTKTIFDYIFVCPKVTLRIEEYSCYLSRTLDRKTLLVSDSFIFGDEILKRAFPDNICLCMYSEVDCRKLSQFSYKALNSHFNYLIGNGTTEMFANSCTNSDQTSGKLQLLISTYSSNTEGAIQVSPPRPLKTSIWKHIVALVCIECLTIIFEEPDVMSLSEEDSAMPIMKGLYKELILLADILGIGTVTSLKLTASKCLRGLLHKESHKRLNRLALLQPDKFAPRYIHAPKLFHDFKHNFAIDADLLLRYLLKLAQSKTLMMPYLESLSGFLDKQLRSRNANLSSSNDPNYISLSQFENINGIAPEKNMMNYPPFLQLPKPTIATSIPGNIVSLMVKEEKKEEFNEGEEILQELIKGREELTYGTKIDQDTTTTTVLTSFQDTTKETQTWPTNISSGQPLPQSNMYDIGSAMPGIFPSTPFLQSPPFLQSQFLVPPTIPIQLPNGGFYYPPPPPQQNLTTGPPLPRFYHSSPPINKDSSSKQLYDMHVQLMEAVKFDESSERTVSNKFGEYDSSTAYLKSSKSSKDSDRGSSKSSSQGFSGGASR